MPFSVALPFDSLGVGGCAGAERRPTTSRNSLPRLVIDRTHPGGCTGEPGPATSHKLSGKHFFKPEMIRGQVLSRLRGESPASTKLSCCRDTQVARPPGTPWRKALPTALWLQSFRQQEVGLQGPQPPSAWGTCPSRHSRVPHVTMNRREAPSPRTSADLPSGAGSQGNRQLARQVQAPEAALSSRSNVRRLAAVPWGESNLTAAAAVGEQLLRTSPRLPVGRRTASVPCGQRGAGGGGTVGAGSGSHHPEHFARVPDELCGFCLILQIQKPGPRALRLHYGQQRETQSCCGGEQLRFSGSHVPETSALGECR